VSIVGWNNPFVDGVDSEHKRRIWCEFQTKWYVIFFRNPYFYIDWSPNFGFAYYCREYISDIRDVFLDPIFKVSTFLEPVNDIERLVLRSFGFNSFFRGPYQEGEPETQEFMLIGFLMFWNSGEYMDCQPKCPIYFQHLYEFEDNLEPDSEVGTEFRTIVDVTKTIKYPKPLENQVNIIYYKYTRDNFIGLR